MSTESVEPVTPESETTEAELYELRSTFFTESSKEHSDIDPAEASVAAAEAQVCTPQDGAV